MSQQIASDKDSFEDPFGRPTLAAVYLSTLNLSVLETGAEQEESNPYTYAIFEQHTNAIIERKSTSIALYMMMMMEVKTECSN